MSRRAVSADQVRQVRVGHGANCSSIGSVVDTLFGTAAAAAAVFAAVVAALATEDVTVAGSDRRGGPPDPPPDEPRATGRGSESAR